MDPSVFLCFLERRMERVIDLGRRARRPAFTRMSPERTPGLLDAITAGSQIKEPVEVLNDAKASFHDSVTGLQTSFFICLAFGFTIWWAHIPDIIPLTPYNALILSCCINCCIVLGKEVVKWSAQFKALLPTIKSLEGVPKRPLSTPYI